MTITWRDRYEVDTKTGCWNWTGQLDWDGRGRWQGVMAYRAVYIEVVGPIAEGLELDHLCLNKRCVRPDHLEPVTRLENIRRRTALRTHCKWGHPFDEANTYRPKSPNGWEVRICRACNRRRVAESKARRLLAVTGGAR